MSTEVSSNFTSRPYVIHMALSISRPASKTLKRMLYWSKCIKLIGPYTLKGKDGTEIDFKCLTMIDLASSWFKIVELPVREIQSSTKAQPETKDAYLDKSSAMISNLVNKTWFSRYPCCKKILMTAEVSSNFTSRPYVIHMTLSVSQPVSKPSSKCYTGVSASSHNDNAPHC